ncbi:MAG: tungsten formylmethanofuran dehydrogenase [Candidatus Marinimicrobia bacterium]|nr:tungsten formylmethanofuran dehydrogenase [Candidatus Neomarinimicrobiota bacterium]
MSNSIPKKILHQAYSLMCTAKAMTDIYEENKEIAAKYVHATSRGHEAIQIALGIQLEAQDWVAPYYRDDALLLSIGLSPYELMLQLQAKKDDPFSGGRSYYCHPSLRRDDMPKIPHQSSATGMQAIPTTGVAMGVQYLEKEKLANDKAVVVCSMGDGSITEGEVSEAFHMAALKQFPILYLIQDNGWDISASGEEIRANDIVDYVKGYGGIEVVEIAENDFSASYMAIQKVIKTIRKERRPFMVHADVPLLNHHTSGVRMEWYRDDLEEHQKNDPLPILKSQLVDAGIKTVEIEIIEKAAVKTVGTDFKKVIDASDPDPEELFENVFHPTDVTKERGERSPKGASPTIMVDGALLAIKELMEDHPECLLYGQDVGRRLGGVFREAATLAETFGDNRVFNTPIQEAFIVGSTVGMSAAGCKPIVEVQFADYIWPGLNQLFTEVSRSCYLSRGKWPVSCIIRVPIGAYGSGGPYHSSSIESVLANIRGIKIVYPSNSADMKGLMKAAYHDPNPVVMLEHKGLYWSKIKGTESAICPEPARDYILPLGKGNVVLEAKISQIEMGNSLTIITYGMGVYWAKSAATKFPGQVEIIDLRTIYPLDEMLIFESVNRHSRCLVVSEEPKENSFAQALAGRIQENCFINLDAPVSVVGAENVPAIPLNSILEERYLPDPEKVAVVIEKLLSF